MELVIVASDKDGGTIGTDARGAVDGAPTLVLPHHHARRHVDRVQMAIERSDVECTSVG